jgi:2'-5' RNA ligase
VALLLDPPLAHEVDGLRRALGDPSLGRVAPHLTLVPPVNVRDELLPAALARLREAAASRPRPLRLTLGPVGTFWPDNPVLYLDVGGELPALRQLRTAVFGPPLERSLSWAWVPHVTLSDTADEGRIAAAVAALDHYASVADFDRLVLLEQHRGRKWLPIADAALGPPIVVGTGGLPVAISRSRIVDPEAGHMLGQAGLPSTRDATGNRGATGNRDVTAVETGGEGLCHSVPPFYPIVLTARRESKVAGVAVAWRAGDGTHVAAVVAPGVRRQGVGGHLLAHLESALRAEEWPGQAAHAHGPPGFYRARSGWIYSKATEAY